LGGRTYERQYKTGHGGETSGMKGVFIPSDASPANFGLNVEVFL
jgi:hypothetical protein